MSVNVDSSTWALRTLGGIPVKVVSRSGEFSDEAASATETYIIRAANLSAFVLESFPVPVQFGSSLFYAERRRMPGLPTLLTKRIRWENNVDGIPSDPFGSDPGAPSGTYDQNLRVHIEYETRTENDAESDPEDPRTYIEINASAGGEFVNSPVKGNGTWTEENTGEGTEVKEINIPQTTIMPETEWSLRWSQIPHDFWKDVLVARLRARVGKVNDAAMSILYDAPQETVLFLGYTFRQQFTWRTGLTGKPPIELELKFAEKNFISPETTTAEPDGIQVTHNHFYRPGVGWRRLKINGSEDVYAQAAMDEIFQA